MFATSFVGELITLDETSGSILWKYPINSTLWPANLVDLDGDLRLLLEMKAVFVLLMSRIAASRFIGRGQES